MLASASDQGVALWEVGQTEPTCVFGPHELPITSIRWTTNDRVLASGSLDGTVALSEPDGALFDTLQPATASEPAAVLAVTWSPASRYLAAGAADALIHIYDLQKRTQALHPVLTLRGHRSAICAISWNPSEVHVASASAVGEVIVHRVQGSVAVTCRAQAADGVPPQHGRRRPAGASVHR